MATHSVADAKNHLSELIDRALRGEGIVITRHGKPVVELRPIKPAARAVTAADVAWLEANRVPSKRGEGDAGTLLSEMRDEEER
jgi:prevent-host-death family protein